jgi:hypothetical protein
VTARMHHACRSFLHSRVSSSAFSPQFLESGYAKYCQKPKGSEVEEVAGNMGIKNRKCVLLYDDT